MKTEETKEITEGSQLSFIYKNELKEFTAVKENGLLTFVQLETPKDIKGNLFEIGDQVAHGQKRPFDGRIHIGTVKKFIIGTEQKWNAVMRNFQQIKVKRVGILFEGNKQVAFPKVNQLLNLSKWKEVRDDASSKNV